jgi:hypothetical protein
MKAWAAFSRAERVASTEQGEAKKGRGKKLGKYSFSALTGQGKAIASPYYRERLSKNVCLLMHRCTLQERLSAYISFKKHVFIFKQFHLHG